MSGWDRDGSAHLTAHERKAAALWLKLRPEDVTGPPVGLLVGERPGPSTSSNLPLFPHPGNSSAARLMRMAHMSPGDFLGKLMRRNLFFHNTGEWDDVAARAEAIKLLDTLAGDTRVVLLGRKVGKAFGFRQFYTNEKYGEISMTCIPHPSGLTREYNEEEHRRCAQMGVRWAAGILFTQVVSNDQVAEEKPDGSK